MKNLKQPILPNCSSFSFKAALIFKESTNDFLGAWQKQVRIRFKLI